MRGADWRLNSLHWVSNRLCAGKHRLNDWSRCEKSAFHPIFDSADGRGDGDIRRRFRQFNLDSDRRMLGPCGSDQGLRQFLDLFVNFWSFSEGHRFGMVRIHQWFG